jgi:hypothetical protein
MFIDPAGSISKRFIIGRGRGGLGIWARGLGSRGSSDSRIKGGLSRTIFILLNSKLRDLKVVELRDGRERREGRRIRGLSTSVIKRRH